MPRPSMSACQALDNSLYLLVKLLGRRDLQSVGGSLLFEAAVAEYSGRHSPKIDLLVEQACDRLMEAEQLTVGWDVGKG